MREARGLSRPQLAKAVKMPVTSLQTLEETPQLTSRYLPALAAYFNVATDWLTTGRGQREAPVKDALNEYGWASHFGNFDRHCLTLALQWLRWQEEQGLESQPERQVDRLIALYRRFLADGGRETAAHITEIANAIEQGEQRVGTTRGTPE